MVTKDIKLIVTENNIEANNEFKTINAALEYLENLDLADKVIKYIYVRKGIYKEKIFIKLPNVVIIGEDRKATVIEFDDYHTKLDNGIKLGTTGSASVTVTDKAVNFMAANLTFKNSFDYKDSNLTEGRQAVSLLNDADKAIYYQVNFIGNQDTLYAKNGRQWYLECYIEGHIDFIFGFGGPAIFENSTIKSLNNNIGYVSANMGIGNDSISKLKYSYIFLDNHFVSNTKKDSVYLGRPWRKDSMMAFINNNFDDHIKDVAFADWSIKASEANYYLANNFKNGKPFINEVSKPLSKTDEKTFSDKKVIFNKNNGEVSFEEQFDYQEALDKLIKRIQMFKRSNLK